MERRTVLFLQSETRADESENGAEKEANSFQATGRGFKFVVFSTTNLNLLFRQTFLVLCVWLKTVRGQSLNLFLCKQKKIPRRVFILYLAFICKAYVDFTFRSKDNVIE